MTVPKMMFASSSAAELMICDASSISCRLMSLPPVMEYRMRSAPTMEDSSSFEEMASLAASAARFSPEAMPMPIIAEPASFMMARTSAKSRLMRPGIVMRSVMPCVP